MQTAEQIKKQITQGEPFIRQFAVQYFHESYSQDPELMLHVLESCQNLEYTGFNQRVLEQSYRFVYTDEAVAKLVDVLSTTANEQKSYVTKKELGAYQWLLAYAPFPLLTAYQAQIDDLPQELKELIEYRRALSELSSQDLWDKFTVTDEDKQAKSHDQQESIPNELLIKELAFRQELTPKRIPQLVNMLQSEQEALIELAMEALIYIGFTTRLVLLFQRLCLCCRII